MRTELRGWSDTLNNVFALLFSSLASVGLTGIGLTYLADALKINRTLKILRYFDHAHLHMFTLVFSATCRIDRNNLGAAECHIITEILRTHDLDLME